MRQWKLWLSVVMTMSKAATFDPPIAKVGDFTLRIDAPQFVTKLETPIKVLVPLSNAGTQTLQGKVQLQVIDRWRIESANPQSFELPPKSEGILEFVVVAGKGTHNAHYPIHAFAELEGGQGTREKLTAHAVLVVEVRAPRELRPPRTKVVQVPERGSVSLWRQGNHRVSFQVFGQPMQTMPLGWWGTDEETGALAFLQQVDRKGVKESIAIHPPWRKGVGTIFVDWQVRLPKSSSIWLDFAFAIRDHDPQRESPSDGVTVRVWGKRNGTGDEWQLLYERHSDSKTWVPARVDVSAFAGQTITLRLEVHPGPKNDTTCDLAFIGEPYLVAGRQPEQEAVNRDEIFVRMVAWARWQMAEAARQWGLLPKDAATQKSLRTPRQLVLTAKDSAASRQADEMARKVLEKLLTPKRPIANRTLFLPPQGTRPALWVNARDGEFYAFALSVPEQKGGWDAIGALVFPDRALSFDGFLVRVLGDDLSDWRSPSVMLSRSEKSEGQRLTVSHHMERNGVPYTLTLLAWSEDGALKLRWQLHTTAPQDHHQPLRITDCAIRSWGEVAERIYVGHGNVLVRPDAFRLHADGHRLSTRHAGMDFANGISVVVGVDNPPDFFECQPQMRHYSIHAHMDTTFTIAASRKSVWQAAKRYRAVDPYKPAPTLPKLAGRFVFDLWDGWRYGWVAEQLEHAFRYGCTDAVVIYHNWQRWGYDYRLPCIFPPNPQFGSLGDFVKMVQVCDRYGVLFAPHDNYIDFYPDAEGFSYRHICFTPDGVPVRAWFNEGRHAQSYRWRPDAFFPFMERNLKLIAQHIKPTAYFVDVFSSIGMFDWWTEDGQFHSILETQQRWGEAFEFIRRLLGGAPQISESGCDWLINWLDGATTNHLRVDPNAPPGLWSVWRIQCDDAERIPWFDFAHHHKFALHGAGYSNRYQGCLPFEYQGGLPYEVAGIYSDDYICTEVLTGHPAMVSEPFGPQVVRKYWLLAELGRSLALVPLSDVTFADGDIHRQMVRYENGATVWVNRSVSDWKVNGRTLPPFGFYARTETVTVAIERLPTTDGESVIAEWALSPQFAYCNARTKFPFAFVPIRLQSAKVQWLGKRQFELVLRWFAEKPTEVPCRIFVHFTHPRSPRGEQIAFQGDHVPPVPTTQWQGEVVTRTIVTVPKEWGADRYSIRIGLWHADSERRLRLMGDVSDDLRLKVGELVLEGQGDNITGVKLELNPKLNEPPQWLQRWNVQGKSVDFGFAVTDGAFRFDRKTLTLIPLPDHPPFTVTLRLAKLIGKTKRVVQVEAWDETGNLLGIAPFTQRGDEITFTTQRGVFAYRLQIK
ncbi:MAG: hypothetical protein IMHGJWDQ_000407 [Candidatus Fervidibacter sp.]